MKIITGIYQIQSILYPNRIYIGSSSDAKRRKREHLILLRKNKQPNKKLQNHFNKYGESDLQFSILLECEKEDLIKIEQYFLDSYNPYFNICKIAGSVMSGMILTEEHKRKIGLAHKGKSSPNKGKIFSEEHKKNMRHPHKKWSEESKRKKSESLIGNKNASGKRSEEKRKRINDTNPNRGKHLSEIHKNKIKESRLGKKRGKYKLKNKT